MGCIIVDNDKFLNIYEQDNIMIYSSVLERERRFGQILERRENIVFVLNRKINFFLFTHHLAMTHIHCNNVSNIFLPFIINIIMRCYIIL